MGGFRLQPGTSLPIVPPIEEDELISSWLDRTAHFYGQPIAAITRCGSDAKQIDLAKVDVGRPLTALKPVALLLGLTPAQLASYTILSAYPGISHLVAREAAAPGSRYRPQLHYAACPHCLERQRLNRGVSWLRCEWVLAPRTVCAVHCVRLVEVQIGHVVHPVWADFLRGHQQSGQPICAIGPDGSASIAVDYSPNNNENALAFYRNLADIQSRILHRTMGGGKRRLDIRDQTAILIADLVWAFTRSDRHCPDRLVYETFALDQFDKPWHMARRRRPGPVDFTTMGLLERHIFIATATVRAASQDWRHMFYAKPDPNRLYVMNLLNCLVDADRTEILHRQKQWPAITDTSEVVESQQTSNESGI